MAFQRRGEPEFVAVDGVSFDVQAGQVVGLVGESGCGKSVTSMAIMRLLPRRGVRVSGTVTMDGEDLLTLSDAQMRDRRGRDLSMVFQDPLSALNPVIPIGLQVTEVLRRHRGMGKEKARTAAAELLDRVGIPDARRRLDSYPHEFSGGMRQRALIAIALACQPRLLIADEPTTALDVTIQAQILELLRELVRETGAALIMITHDLGVVAGLCDMVNVLYGGKIVERAQRNRLFGTPRHPYTHGLLRSIPRLDAPAGEPLEAIPGSVVDNLPWARGLRVRAALRAGDPALHRADARRGGRRRAAAALLQPGPGERGVSRGRSDRLPAAARRAGHRRALPDQARAGRGPDDRARLRGRRGVADHRPRRDLRAGRRVRLRQVDARPDLLRLERPDRRPGAVRRAGHRPAAGRSSCAGCAAGSRWCSRTRCPAWTPGSRSSRCSTRA